MNAPLVCPLPWVRLTESMNQYCERIKMLGKWLFYSEEGNYLAQFTFHLQSLQRVALHRSGAVALLEILRFSSQLAACSVF